MDSFDKIHLTWRSGLKDEVHSVDILQRQPDGKIIFQYDIDLEKLKKEEGFVPYTAFQHTTKICNGNVADIFSQSFQCCIYSCFRGKSSIPY